MLEAIKLSKRQDRDEFVDRSLIFEDAPEPAVEVLSLSDCE